MMSSFEAVEIQVVLPPCSHDPLSDMLRYLTKAIEDKTGDETGYGLGGRHGYGGHWNSAVFEMRPYYWGDCDCGYDELESEWCETHSHSDTCYQAELKREQIAAGGKVHPKWGWVDWPEGLSWDRRRAIEDAIYDKLCAKFKRSRKFGCAVHCTCSYQREWKKWAKINRHEPTCTPELPNFLHRASGLEVRWYKYIGRGMEVKNLPADLTPVFNECLRDIASGMEARSDATPKSGAAEGDSPAPTGDAQPEPPNNTYSGHDLR
jgi:hypothetical protein